MLLDGYNKCLVNIKKIFIILINYVYFIINFYFVLLDICIFNLLFLNIILGLWNIS